MKAFPRDPETTFATIVRAQAQRYLGSVVWAVGLVPIAGWRLAAAYLALMIASGMVRGWLDGRQAQRLHGGTAQLRVLSLYTLSVVAHCAVACIGPVVAMLSGHPAGPFYTAVTLVSGYHLTFIPLRSAPRVAMAASLPYSLTLIWVASTAGAAGWVYALMFPIVLLPLWTQVVYGRIQARVIAQHRARQGELMVALQAQRDAAEEASRAKSAFLAMMSHELRTPMNGVLGCAQLLERTSLDPEQKELLGVAQSSGTALMKLLNDLLDFSKAEADRIELELIEQDPRDVIQQAARTWRPPALDKGLTFEVRELGEIPERALIDGGRIVQILHNLLSNAVKFTSAGSIVVEIAGRPDGQGRSELAIRVKDSGPGIAAEDAERLFEPFSQADASVTRRFGGTGLGLAISRRLARLMGGELCVRSRTGGGAVFELVFTASEVCGRPTASEVAPPETREDAAGEGRSILVVEDHPVNQMVLTKYLTALGHSVVCADDGLAATEITRDQPFDMILMDVNMPVMDGLTAVRLIRCEPGPNQETPIIVLSALAGGDDRQLGEDAGADGYLTKPINMAELVTLMNGLERPEAGLSPVAAAAGY